MRLCYRRFSKKIAYTELTFLTHTSDRVDVTYSVEHPQLSTHHRPELAAIRPAEQPTTSAASAATAAGPGIQAAGVGCGCQAKVLAGRGRRHLLERLRPVAPRCTLGVIPQQTERQHAADTHGTAANNRDMRAQRPLHLAGQWGRIFPGCTAIIAERGAPQPLGLASKAARPVDQAGESDLPILFFSSLPPNRTSHSLL